jgi:hypothetical protein
MQDTYYLRNRIEDGEILSPGINMHAYIMYVNIRALCNIVESTRSQGKTIHIYTSIYCCLDVFPYKCRIILDCLELTHLETCWPLVGPFLESA